MQAIARWPVTGERFASTIRRTSMVSLAWNELMGSGAMFTVVNETQFGVVSEIRASLAVLLAACLAFNRFALACWGALAIGPALVAAIAWTGHAGSTLGGLGNLHLAADVPHLIAASAWIGHFAGPCVLFAAGRRRPWAERGSLQIDAISRFSILGTVSVAALIASESVHAWIQVGSVRALLATDYGRLLLLNLAAFAAVNRFYLTPQLTAGAMDGRSDHALAALTRNTFIEIALGLTIVAMVGVLGTLYPAINHCLKRLAGCAWHLTPRVLCRFSTGRHERYRNGRGCP